MHKFDIDKMKRYVDSYEDQIGYETYQEETIIDDFLYGIGICLDVDEYEFADGYKRFRIRLLEKLAKDLNININTNEKIK